eukprot:TRINITY_DN939_c0_g1_i11.p1 TRINITY_DN939_c0_g1~~TRINITY_DN939_c0_g1_i11.p1  ORF type:complete len:462 (-),score=45.10 TRINITY_DN939_c0_g1_i11:1148-2533(-)
MRLQARKVKTITNTSSSNTGEKRAWRRRHEDFQSTSAPSTKSTCTTRSEGGEGSSEFSQSIVEPTATSEARSIDSPSRSNSIAAKLALFEQMAESSSPKSTGVERGFRRTYSERPVKTSPSPQPTQPSNSVCSRLPVSISEKVGAVSDTANSHSISSSSTGPPKIETRPRFKSNQNIMKGHRGEERRIGCTTFLLYRKTQEGFRVQVICDSSRNVLQQRKVFSRKFRAPSNPKKKVLVPSPELDKRRSLIVGELLSTEESYVNGLKQLCEKYRDPMIKSMGENSKSFDNRHRQLIDDVYSDIHTILSINSTILADLQQVYSSWTDQSQIGEILCRITPFLKLYAVYSSNYNKAIQSLNELFANKGDWITKFIFDRNVFESLLILPIQRIPRYRLLVEDLIENTLTDHQDYHHLHTALDVIKEAANLMDTSIRRHQNSVLLSSVGLAISRERRCPEQFLHHL